MKIFGHELDNVLWKLGFARRLNSGSKSADLRAQVLNGLISKYSYDRYLEVGLYFGKTFEAVSANVKYGVDPSPRFSMRNLPSNCVVSNATSDEFFSNYCDESFDLIFVDGLHESGQCQRDFLNSLRFLREGGVVVLDDVWPHDKYSALPDQHEAFRLRREETGVVNRQWQGDVFRVLMWCISSYGSLECDLVGEPGAAVAVLRPNRETEHIEQMGSNSAIEPVPEYLYSDFLDWVKQKFPEGPISVKEFQSKA